MFSLAVFKDADAARIFAGQAISQACDKMMTVGLIWVIAGMGSLRLVPWFLAAGALPHLLLSRSAAKAIARLGTLRVVVAADAARGVIYLAAWALWPELSRTAQPAMSLLFAVAILANAGSALFNPAILSLPMSLPRAEEGLLQPLTALIDSCFSLGAIAGPLAAALLYPWLGLAGLFLANGLSYFLAAFLESKIKTSQGGPNPGADPAPRAPAKIREGRIALEDDRLIHFLLGAFFLMNLAFTPILAFLPLFTKVLFHGGIATLSGMEASLGLGMAAGSLLLSILRAEGRSGTRIISSLLAISLMYLLFALNHVPSLACIVLFGLGLSLSVLNVTLLALFQSRPQEHEVPVVMGWVNLISVGALPLSMAFMGGLIEKMDLGALALGCACALLALSLATAAHPELRNL